MARISKPTRICMILSAAVLVLLATLCVVGVLLFHRLFSHLIGKKIAIVPGSEVFENWKSPTVPIYFSIYLYNLTNPKEFLNGSNPHFEEVGPYVYIEDRQRFDISFSEESPPATVSFKHRIFYYFVPELSVGPDDQGSIISLDLVSAALGSTDLPIVFAMSLYFLTFQATVMKTPREIIWGYEHAILELCHSLDSTRCKTSRTGLMANNNGTKVHEYVIDTGAYEPSNVGKVLKHNNRTELNHWGSVEANMINGTDGSVARPNLDIGSRIYFFVPDFCRSFHSDAVAKTTAKHNPNVELLRFSSSSEQAMNATLNPANRAYCPKLRAGPECPPTGMIPLSPCGDSSIQVPVFASQPHFFGADPIVSANLNGIKKPNKANDSTTVHIEPNTGFVLEAYKKMQINIYIENNDQLGGVYEKMSGPYFFPLVWFTEVAVANEQVLDRIYKLVLRPKRLLPLGLSIFGAFAAVLAVTVIVVLATCSHLERHTSKHSKNVELAYKCDPNLKESHTESQGPERSLLLKASNLGDEAIA